MHSLFKSRHVIANRLLLGSILVFSAFSGFGCPDTGSAASSYTATNFAYITNASDNSITTYSVDSTTGALARLGTTAAGHTPVAIVALSSNAGGFVYVVNKDDNSISQYQFGKSGSLTPLAPPTVATGAQPVAICELTVQGYESIFVANRMDNSISYYNVNSDGTLKKLSTFSSAGMGPVKLAGIGGELDVLNSGDGTLCKFGYTSGSGGTNLVSKLSLPSNSLAIDMDKFIDNSNPQLPVNVLLYVVDSNLSTLSKYQADPTISALQSVTLANVPVSIVLDTENATNPANNDRRNSIYVGSQLGFIYQYIEDAVPASTIVAQTAPPVTFPPQQVILRDSGSTPVIDLEASNASGVPDHKLYVLLTDSNTVRVYSTLTTAVVGNIQYDTGAIDTSTMTETPTGKYPSDIAFATYQVANANVITTVRSARKTR